MTSTKRGAVVIPNVGDLEDFISAPLAYKALSRETISHLACLPGVDLEHLLVKGRVGDDLECSSAVSCQFENISVTKQLAALCDVLVPFLEQREDLKDFEEAAI